MPNVTLKASDRILCVAWSTLCLLAAILVAISAVLADGIMLPRHLPKDVWERQYVTEVDQKAAVLFDGRRETLVISPSFRGSAGSFAWVVPVPSRPTVSIVQGSLFHELSAIAYAHQPQPLDAVAGIRAGGLDEEKSVQVLERRVVGAYDVSVLDANDGTALQTWLKANGYPVPASITGPLRWYISQHWTFVASRIKVPAISHGLASGTLAPIKLTFPAAHPIYPMRLSSANADPFSLLVYIIRPLQADDPAPASDLDQLEGPGAPATQIGQGYATDRLRARRVSQSRNLHPGAFAGYFPPDYMPMSPRTPLLTDMHADRASQPTLFGLVPGRMAIYIKRGTFAPALCTQDFMWEH